MIKYLLILTSFLFADIAIEPWGTSYHYDRDRNYNEDNKYISITYRYDQYDFGVATFDNSHNNRSNYAYVGYRKPINKYLGVFMSAGIITGYNYPVFGAVGVYAEYSNAYIKLSVNPRYLGTTIGYIFEGL